MSGLGPSKALISSQSKLSSADTRSPCEFLFAVRALHAGKGRGVQAASISMSSPSNPQATSPV